MNKKLKKIFMCILIIDNIIDNNYLKAHYFQIYK